MSFSFLKTAWFTYSAYVEAAMLTPSDQRKQDLHYWQEKVFATAILYGLPLAVIALLPTVYIQAKSGSLTTAVFEIIATLLYAWLPLCPRLSLKFRKCFVVILVAFSSISLAILMGELGIAFVYLLSLSVFVALVYSNRIAYWMIVVNILILACFAIAIKYSLFEMDLVMGITFERWTIYCASFVLLNLILVMLIRQILNGLIRTIQREGILKQNLQNSEKDYRKLFFHSTLPKLVFDTCSLRFLQVNKAATEVYGYTEQEFLKMKITDIRAKDSPPYPPERAISDETEAPLKLVRSLHVAKDGRKIYTELSCSSISFKGKNASMIIATDITQLVEFTQAIQQQNEKLREIAFIQSHVIRLPLARIMSIAELISTEYEGKIDPELLNFLDISTKELDNVIRDLVNKSASVK